MTDSRVYSLTISLILQHTGPAQSIPPYPQLSAALAGPIPGHSHTDHLAFDVLHLRGKMGIDLPNKQISLIALFTYSDSPFPGSEFFLWVLSIFS